MDILGSLGDMADDARLILVSDPTHLSQFAERWQSVASAIEARKLPLKHTLDSLYLSVGSQLAPAIMMYNNELAEDLEALVSGANSVAVALRDAAPRLAGIRAELYNTLAGLGIGIIGGVIGAIATEGGSLGTVIGGAELTQIIRLIDNYNASMVGLRNSFQATQTTFAVLDALNAAKGGMIPAPPRLPAPS